MIHAKSISFANFEDEVIQSKVPVIVDFYADWCAPCRMIGPVLDRVAESFVGRAKVVKVNVEKEPELASQFNVSSIPTLLFVQEGEIVGKHTGVASQKALEHALERMIQS